MHGVCGPQCFSSVFSLAARARYPRIKTKRELAESFHFRSFSDMGTKRLDTISAYARHGFNLQVKCRGCGRVAVIDARALSISCTAASLSRDMGAIRRRLRCQGCGGREVACGPVER